MTLDSSTFTTTGVGKYGARILDDTDRPCAGAAAAVGAAEGFVGVVVLHVGAEVAGAGDAEDGVHVRAVEIDEAAAGVDGIGDLAHLRLEDADRVRVGDHEHGDLVVEMAMQVVHIERAGRERFHGDRFEAGHRGAGGVGAVGTIGHEDFGALFAAIAEVGGSDPQGREFAMRTGGRLQEQAARPEISLRYSCIS